MTYKHMCSQKPRPTTSIRLKFFIFCIILDEHSYSMNKFVTNKSRLPQDGTQVFPYMG